MNPLSPEEEMRLSIRRKTLFGTKDMVLLDIASRPSKRDQTARHLHTFQGDDVLPWIEKYTQGDFYLSDFTIGFKDPYDLLMFKLAFEK